MEAFRHFQTPRKSLGDLNPEIAATVIAAAADVALVVDGGGVIRDVAFGNDELTLDGHGQWTGQPWADTVTVESRPKVAELLQEAVSRSRSRWRQVSYPSSAGADVPILYSAIQVGNRGRVVVVGRDLRLISSLQQRLVEAQQSVQRDFERVRHAETRYRLLFQLATEAVLVLDAQSGQIQEANPAAAGLLGVTQKRLLGATFPVGLDERGARVAAQALAQARRIGRIDKVCIKGAERQDLMLAATLFRQEGGAHLLVRLAPVAAAPASAGQSTGDHPRLLDVMDRLPDGFVVTDAQGQVLAANQTFIDLVQLATEDQVRGVALDRWLGRGGVDLSVLVSNMRQHGSVRLFASKLRGEYGLTVDVEISAVLVADTDPHCIGFSIRSVESRAISAPRERVLPRSVDQLTELVGRTPMKEIVRETTDIIERLCIEAALQLTQDNRASAAEMLGLSRQSLYVKLRRFGIGGLDGSER
jgi:transcriptional regulator PpsR